MTLVPDRELLQLSFFGKNIDLGALRARAEELRQNERAENTKISYAVGWKQFQAWCVQADRPAMPASVETVCLWVVSLLQSGRAPSTVSTRLGAVAHAHRAAGHTLDRSQASELITAAKRETGFRQRGMRPLTVDQARRISADLAIPGGRRSLGVAMRDRAMFLLGLASGMRRSELASLQLADLEQSAAGLLVTIRRSKTDQEGRGRSVGIQPGSDLELCPCRAVAAWLAIRGDGAGPLFLAWCFRSDAAASPVRAVGDDAIYYRLKSALKRIGVDPAGYGAHSLRSGMVTAAAAAGASVPAIMARTGHRSVAMVERYTRGADPFAFDPLRGVL